MIFKSILTIIFSLFLVTGTYATKPFKFMSGKVIKVYDGDTVTIRGADGEVYKIRMLNIDTPEKKQDYGIVSRDFLRSLIMDKNVTIKYKTKDRYGRVVGLIFNYNVSSEQSINAIMVIQGHAWVYRSYLTKPFRHWTEWEDKAKQAKRGLWKTNPTPPWVWRNPKKYLNYPLN